MQRFSSGQGSPFHLVLRSSKASGALSFLHRKNKVKVEGVVRHQASKFDVRIAKFATVGNHLHLMLRFSRRKNFQKFLKSVTALIARFITGARRGNPFGKFWDALAFTRVLVTPKERAIVVKYVSANVVEAANGKVARESYLNYRQPWEIRMYKVK